MEMEIRTAPIVNSSKGACLGTRSDSCADSGEQLKISIVVPVYNAEKYLSDCVNCILQSSYRNLEVILVDDGSTDNSYRMSEQFVSKDCRVKLIRSSDDGENLGTATTKNTGLAAVTGDAVHFCDADDYVQKDFYSLLANSMIENQADVVVGSGFCERSGYINSVPPGLYLGLLGRLSCNPGLMNDCWAYLFRKDFLKSKPDLVFPKLLMGQSLIFLMKSLFYAKRVFSVPEAVYYYRYNPKSATQLKDLEKKRYYQQLTGKLLDDFAFENIPDEIWERCKRRNWALQDKFFDDFVSDEQIAAGKLSSGNR